jgi:WD40 repeat protein/tRNA A-37 threonylcarbamoyl transferase component Bud32
MPDETLPLTPPPPQGLDDILAEYVAGEEQGRPPDRQGLLSRYPQFAADLREFFANRDEMQRLAAPLRDAPEQGTAQEQRSGHPLLKIRYFGDYELLEEIAVGGMGIVYKARQVSLNRIVAVKMILKGTLAREEDVKRFLAEAEAAANLQHPAIVAIHEVGLHEGQHYFSMDYVDGQSLAQLPREQPLTARQAAEYVRDAAEAVHYAHQQGTLHRDLKPSNILIDSQGRVRITDFGLAKKITSDSDLTHTGQILGTPSYMPPEQALGKRSLIGAASDIYSLGAVLYELLTGRPPFRGESPAETLRQVETLDPISPRLLNPATPRDLETICLKCLEKEPHKRFGTAELMADDLGRYLRGEPILARPISRPARVLRWCRRNPVVASLAATTAAAVAAAIVILVVSNLRVSGALAERTHALASLRVEQGKTRDALADKTKAAAELDASNQKLRTSLLNEKEVQSRLASTNQSLREAVDRERATSYGNQIALAQHEYVANRLERATEVLNGCRRELRGWEWDYLKRLCDANGLRTFQARIGVTQKSVPVSPNGEHLAVRFGNQIRVHRVSDGKEEITFDPGRVGFTLFSPDGRWIATASDDESRSFEQKRSLLSIWEIADQTLRSKLDLPWMTDDLSRVAISPDGKLIAGIVAQWVADSKAIGPAGAGPGVKLLLDGKAVDTTVSSVVLPGGARVRSSGTRIKVWDTNSNVEQLSINGGTHLMGGVVTFSPDGKWLAFDRGSAIVLWDVGEGKESRLIPLAGPVGCLAFSRDGQRLATNGPDGTAQVWDFATGRELFRLWGHAGVVNSVAFSSDGKRIATGGSDATARIWDAQAGRQLLIYRVPRAIQGVAFAVSDQRLITTTGSFGSGAGEIQGKLTIWDATTGPDSAELPGPRCGIGMAISPNGTLLAVGSYSDVIVWDIAKRAVRHTLHGHGAEVYGLAFSPNGEQLASASNDRTAKVWDIAGERELLTLKGHKDGVYTVAFSGDGQRLATTSADRTVKLWDLTDGSELATLQGKKEVAPQWDYMTTVAFSPDSRYVAAGGYDKTVRIWNAQSFEELLTFRGHDNQDSRSYNRVYSLSYSFDGKFIASAADKLIKIWNAKTGEELLTLKGHSALVYDVCFSPDGRRLASTGGGALKIWDTSSGQELISFPNIRNASVRFSPDGRLLAAIDDRYNVQLWEAGAPDQSE